MKHCNFVTQEVPIWSINRKKVDIPPSLDLSLENVNRVVTLRARKQIFEKYRKNLQREHTLVEGEEEKSIRF